MKQIWKLLLSIPCFFALTGCDHVEKQNVPMPIVAENTAYSETTTAETTTTTTTTTTTILAPAYQQNQVQVPVCMEMPAEVCVQAEDCTLSEIFAVENTCAGFTGSGYVTGLSGELQNTFGFPVSVPSSQHYDITVVMAADETDAQCDVTIEQTPYDTITKTITIAGTGNFIEATIPNVYMTAGTHSVLLQQQTGSPRLDCLYLTNTSSEAYTPAEVSATPCDSKATAEASELLAFLSEQYGKTMLAGQYASSAENAELTEIYQTTGQYPAIRFADIADGSESAVDASIDWAKQGGIVGLMWSWESPSKTASSIYADATDFSLYSAATIEVEKIASCTPKKLQELEKEGTISTECLNLINDIDDVAEMLLQLQEENIPVLWRPLHEAGNGWYWWSSCGGDAYAWLWDLLYQRLTTYHKLHNLIWIWNGQSADYPVYMTEYDIASVDIYLDPSEDFSSQYEQFYALQQLQQTLTGSTKLIALSECSTIPDLSDTLRDKSVWSFFGLWYGEYLLDDSAGYTTKEQMIEAYNSDLVMTLSEYLICCNPDGYRGD